MTRIEGAPIPAVDRRRHDEREGAWKAFHVLERVEWEAGCSGFGRKATKEIIDGLSGIHTRKFGRARYRQCRPNLEIFEVSY